MDTKAKRDLTDEEKAKFDSMIKDASPDRQMATAMLLAFSNMDKLSDGQRRDLVLAGLDAFRDVVIYETLTKITDDWKIEDEAALGKIVPRIAAVGMKATMTIKPKTKKFFTLTDMIKD